MTNSSFLLSFEFLTAIAVSPLVYNGILWISKYCCSSSSPAAAADASLGGGSCMKTLTRMHNYNMTCQSLGLFGLTLYEYVSISHKYGIPWHHFLSISNKGADIHRNGENAYIIVVFLGSKLWEWLDTVLLIANGKPYGTLHWWHHSTITLSFYTGFYISTNYLVGLMNSFIHVIMYMYYAEMAGIRPFAKYLTSLQIIQLFSGFGMSMYSYFRDDSWRYRSFSLMNAFLCLSYGLLFVQFYIAKYENKPKKRGKKEKEEEEEKKTTTRKIVEIAIGEYRYDVTDFKHPGGNVIHYYTNGGGGGEQDATAAFLEFHYRSKKARLVLQSLPRTLITPPRPRPSPADGQDKEDKEEDKEDKEKRFMRSFHEFREDLVSRGFFQPSMLHVLGRMLEIVSLFALATYSIRIHRVLSVLLFGLVNTRCGWIQHEGGHNSLTGNIVVDKRIQNVFMAFGLFIDGSMWNSMHNKHHATPQKIGHDIDLDTAPLVAFHEKCVDVGGIGRWRWWYKYQKYTFLPITSGFLVNMFWMFYLHPRKMLRDKNVLQCSLIVSSHLLRVYLFREFGGGGGGGGAPISWTAAIGYHLASVWVSSMYLFGHFSLSHTFTPVIESHETPNWARYAIEHTVDICPGNGLVSWMMGYLNCQVVHHLFPSMPQFYGPRVSEEVRRFCDQWGLEYRVVGYFEAWKCMFSNLDHVGKTLSTSTTSRSGPGPAKKEE